MSKLPVYWLTDMDGVLVHEGQMIPGADGFLDALRATGRRYLVLTNNPIFTQRDLSARLARTGLDVPEDCIWTSATATAQFLQSQRPNGSAFVIGEAGLTTALHEVGYVLVERDPDYVVLGETRRYSFEQITTAVRLIEAGARFICTNPDATGPSPDGTLPAVGAVAAMISAATGVTAYFVGKPNPLMMRSALNRLQAHSESSVMIGDRLDTDVRSGLEAGLATILVLSGVTQPSEVHSSPFTPTRVIGSVSELIDEITADGPVSIDEKQEAAREETRSVDPA
ncbi:MAG TPA: HAD-IIA family hydrolase [Jiangellaceae bacterium]